MPKDQIVRNIFLDTQVFEAECFDPSSQKLKALADLIESGALILFSTKITIEEIRSRIRKNTSELKKAVKEAVRDGRTNAIRIAKLADERFCCLLKRPDVEALADCIWKQLQAYLDRVGVQTVEIDEVKPSRVFDDYFQLVPPFSSERQKQPFPDAFSVAALECWCEANDEQMYVVSNDSDIERACRKIDNLVHVHALTEVIVAAERNRQHYPEAVQALVERNPDKLAASIEKAFRDIPIYLDDEDGDATVDSVDVQLGTSDVVWDTEAPHRFIVYVWADVSFDADAEFADRDMQVWDSEDREILTFGYKSERLKGTQYLEVTAVIECDLSHGSPAGYEVRQVDIGAKEPIFLDVSKTAVSSC